jgi:hypothetical protein
VLVVGGLARNQIPLGSTDWLSFKLALRSKKPLQQATLKRKSPAPGRADRNMTRNMTKEQQCR